jgi:hypothetical protein
MKIEDLQMKNVRERQGAADRADEFQKYVRENAEADGLSAALYPDMIGENDEQAESD